MAKFNLADYDSRAVREAARRLSKCAQSLSDGTRGKIRTIRAEIPANLEGEAAKALQARMNDLTGDVNTIIGSINGLVQALNKYADELERTAARLRRMMQG